MTDHKAYRHRFPISIIQHAVWRYHRFPLSYRDVQELLQERGVSEQQRELAELVERRRIVLDLSVAEKNRLSQAFQQKVRADIESHLALLDDQRQSLNKELARLIDECVF